MKCPKCGFVSYPGLAQCKKCGHKFHLPAPRESPSLFSTGPLGLSLGPEPAPPEEPLPPAPISTQAEAVPSPKPLSPESRAGTPEPVPGPREAPRDQPPRPWREELSERVENFRRRRARLKGFDSSDNLDFDFAKAGEPEVPRAGDVLAHESLRAGAPLDVEFGQTAGPESELPILEADPLEQAGGGLEDLRPASRSAGEVVLERPPAASEPLEIVVHLPERPTPPGVVEAALPVPSRATLGRRFLAGVADFFVLLLGGGVFTLIFWRAGGQLTPVPLNLAVLAFIALFFLVVYFGLFTALIASTPGLLWMGLEVRNLQGAHPTPQESFWRAFGYLVSTSALMLGFVWALADSDGLTWHDRMSGTLLVTIAPEGSAEGLRITG